MKLVKCVIQPHKLDDAVRALESIVPGMTVSEVRGHGHQRGHSMIYRGLEYEVSLAPKMMIDIVIDDNKVDDVVKMVVEASRTGQIGDGRIFVVPVEENYHIRTGFMDLG